MRVAHHKPVQGVRKHRVAAHKRAEVARRGVPQQRLCRGARRCERGHRRGLQGRIPHRRRHLPAAASAVIYTNALYATVSLEPKPKWSYVVSKRWGRPVALAFASSQPSARATAGQRARSAAPSPVWCHTSATSTTNSVVVSPMRRPVGASSAPGRLPPQPPASDSTTCPSAACAKPPRGQLVVFKRRKVPQILQVALVVVVYAINVVTCLAGGGGGRGKGACFARRGCCFPTYKKKPRTPEDARRQTIAACARGRTG